MGADAGGAAAAAGALPSSSGTASPGSPIHTKVALTGTTAPSACRIFRMVPLAGLGYGNVMLMTVSRDQKAAPVQLGNCLAVTVALGLMLVMAISGAYLFLLPYIVRGQRKKKTSSVSNANSPVTEV